MITKTLSSSLILYHIHRNRHFYLTRMERRKAFLYSIGITICVTASAVLWIVYA